ncbi:hypothetical protein KP509_14G085500 [Ceratopteris richardii]|uniref:Uncharacterized protein n=1 Tax=Ceratopteris richardii TaxID=49495 RepID=A0A8T2TEZ2_CERRI|nr:hypothetical protein KP509_14G085500 [Ceratopteris richardii]
MESSKGTHGPEPASCRKKKPEGASFLEDVRTHIDEFLNASMEEHQSCLINTLQKMLGISKAKNAKNSFLGQESILDLKVTTSK